MNSSSVIAAGVYLALFVPFGVFFTRDGLPQPYATILGGAILVGSFIVGRVVGRAWALALPGVPWAAALVLIALADADDFGEVSRTGAMILWSFVFAFLVVLVAIGVASTDWSRSRGAS